MYNQHTKGTATTRDRSLIERGGKKAFVRGKGLANTQEGKKKTYVREKKDSST